MVMIHVSEESSKFVFWNRTRIYIILLSLVCLTLSQINSLTFTFTVICMDDLIEQHYEANQTGVHFMESTTHKSILFSGVAIGSMIGLVPSVPLISHFGIRNILTLTGVISAFGSVLFPIAASINYYLVLICRILQGIGISTIFTAVAVIPGAWSPNNEMGTCLAVLSCALQAGSVVCMAVSGLLCESTLGWRSIYYIFGGLTFVCYAIFYFTYEDDPKFHRNVSERELSIIKKDKIESKGREPVPYQKVLFDPCVIACLISVFGGNLGFFILVLYGPTYLKNVLDFDVKSTGLASALPFFLSALAKIIAGQATDRMKGFSEKSKFLMCAAVSQLGMAIAYIIMAWTNDKTIAQISYTLAVVFSGIIVMGTIKCLQLRCRQHVHFGISVVSFTANVIQFAGPIFVGFIVPNNSGSEFALLFYIIAGIIIVTNIPFPFLSTAEPGKYVFSKENKEEQA